MSDRNRGMRRIASSGESVGRFGWDYINLRHGKADFLSDSLHYAVNPRQLLACHRLRPVSGQRNLVGKEIRDKVGSGGDNQRPYHARLATKGASDCHQQQGQCGK